MILSTLFVNGLIPVLKKSLPFVIVFILSVAVVGFIVYQWESANEDSYKQGVERGRKDLQADFDKKALEIQQKFNDELEELKKKAIENEQQAESDAALARDVTTGLRKQLSNLRTTIDKVATANGISDGPRKAVLLLADLLEESRARGDSYAGFADKAFNAAEQCNLEYEAIRRSYANTEAN